MVVKLYKEDGIDFIFFWVNYAGYDLNIELEECTTGNEFEFSNYAKKIKHSLIFEKLSDCPKIIKFLQ